MKTAVLLATYNGEKYISQMLRSLELQTEDNFICYIHDDGSTDRTREIILDYVLRVPQQFVVLDYPKTGGAKENFFSLLERVEADYYLFADQDDVWLPEKMHEMLSCIHRLENEEVFIAEENRAKTNDNRFGYIDATAYPFLVFSDMVVVREDMSLISQSFHQYIGVDPTRLNYQQILLDNPAAGCSMLFNQALKKKVLEYTYLDEIPMHDSWVLAVASLFGAIRYIRTPLVCYRQHGDNEVGATKKQSLGKRILRNINSFFNGSFMREKRKFHAGIRKEAHQLLQLSNLPDQERMTLQEFVDLPRHGKMYRMKFYKRHGFKRQHHDFWMRLWV